MERKTAYDFDQDLLILFDAYVHGALDRRGFLDKAAKYAVGGVTGYGEKSVLASNGEGLIAETEADGVTREMVRERGIAFDNHLRTVGG